MSFKTSFDLIFYAVALMIDLPRHGSGTSIVRPFNVIASGVDVLLEIKPEGKVCYLKVIHLWLVDAA